MGSKNFFVCHCTFFSLSNALASSSRKVVGSVGCTLRGGKCPIPSRARLLGFVNPPLTSSFTNCLGLPGSRTRSVISACQRCFTIGKLFRGHICSNTRSVLTGLGQTKMRLILTASGPRGFTHRVLRRFRLSGCFRRIIKTALSKGLKHGSSVVGGTLGSLRVGSRRRIVVVKSHRCSVDKTGSSKLSSVNILCNFKEHRRLERTNTARVTRDARRIIGCMLKRSTG